MDDPAWRLRYHPEVVRKDIPRLEAAARRRVQRALEAKLLLQPESFGKPLAYNRSGVWSLRVDSWRVLFVMRDDELWILRIGHRREAYDAPSRQIP